jgi:predicted dehydrogenase
LSKNIWNYLKAMSKKPHYESIFWGKERSIFASIIYYFVYLIRFFSPLQMLKQYFRYKGENSKTDKKERIDFHAFHTEIYLIFVFIFFSLNYFYNFFASYPILKTIILMTFLLESIFWILYYMLFRILIEKHLTIFNEAEYFLCLPIVISTQLLIISSLLSVEPFIVLSTMFNLSYDTSTLASKYKIILSFMGYLYTTVIIANMINLLPAIPVQKRPNITIIGAGDVVKNRILLGLEDIYKSNQIAIISPFISEKFKKILSQKGILYKETRTTEDVIKFIKNRSSFAIIATPTQFHYEYIVALSQNKIPFAVEKPITHIKCYLETLQKNDKLMENGFLLSYYWLEKALALNFFLNLNPIYQELLEIEIDKQSNNINATLVSELHLLKLKLGEIQSVNINFIEGDETQERIEWTFDEKNGGMIFETLVHPITLLCNLFDNYQLINFDEILWNRSDKNNILNITGAEIKGKHKNTQFKIHLDKFQTKKRDMTIQYQNGEITLDLENNNCLISYSKSNNHKKYNISIKKDLSKKYEIQMLLVDKFIQNNAKWEEFRFDDYPNQINILNFLYDRIYVKFVEENNLE